MFYNGEQKVREKMHSRLIVGPIRLSTVLSSIIFHMADWGFQIMIAPFPIAMVLYMINIQ